MVSQISDTFNRLRTTKIVLLIRPENLQTFFDGRVFFFFFFCRWTRRLLCCARVTRFYTSPALMFTLLIVMNQWRNVLSITRDKTIIVVVVCAGTAKMFNDPHAPRKPPMSAKS